MAILDIFKKKPRPRRDVGGAPVPTPTPTKMSESRKNVGSKVSEKKEEKPKERENTFAYRILKSPQISEKATDSTKLNQYIFKVYPDSNKIQIRKAIEGLYGVDVLGVRIINIPARQRNLGRSKGWRGGYKKAIIKIKQGQKIEVLPR